MIEPSPTGMCKAIADGAISSLDATDAYLERIAHLDDRIGAFITLTADSAHEQARVADEALASGHVIGPLHGLPFVLKDNIATRDVKTTMGSSFFADDVPAADAEVVRRMRQAGAVLLGKVSLSEFAYGATNQNPHYGPCRNPWDLDCIPGGSSGGSGAAVAADFCAVALGTDTTGSVRIPAALNGVSGLRPSTGRISMNGVFPITWSFDTVGLLARAVSDLSEVFAVLSGYDSQDTLSVQPPPEDRLAALDASIEGLRVGVPSEFFFEDVSSDIARLVIQASTVLSDQGAHIREIGLPGAAQAVEAITRMTQCEAYAIHQDRLAESSQDFGRDVHRRLLLGKEITGGEYAQFRQRGRLWCRTVEDAFDDIDVILTPTTPTTAPHADAAEMIETTRRLVRLTTPWSLAGTPALSLPCGLSETGLPVGVQLIARRFCEALLLKVGAVYQRETEWHCLRPPS